MPALSNRTLALRPNGKMESVSSQRLGIQPDPTHSFDQALAPSKVCGCELWCAHIWLLRHVALVAFEFHHRPDREH
jgi:hypothetical protein